MIILPWIMAGSDSKTYLLALRLDWSLVFFAYRGQHHPQWIFWPPSLYSLLDA